MEEVQTMSVDNEIIFDGTHKILFLDSETLEVIMMDYISPPFVLGVDFVKGANENMQGIISTYIIVEKSYEGQITQEMLTDFQREIAYQVLDRSLREQDDKLMSESTDYDEYTAKETTLKKLYFQVKMQIKTSVAPLLLNLSLIS